MKSNIINYRRIFSVLYISKVSNYNSFGQRILLDPVIEKFSKKGGCKRIGSK